MRGWERGARPRDEVTETMVEREVNKRLRAKRTRLVAERREFGKTEDEDYQDERKDQRAIVRMSDYFRRIPDEDKNKTTFENAVGLFLIDNTQRRGHIEFIFAAMRMMREFGVEKDLACYKRLFNLFPSGGKLIPPTKWAADFLHYPRDQECAILFIDQMEYNGVLIDKEFFDMVTITFGTVNETAQKIQRLAYWQTKFKNLSPYPTPRVLPADGLEVAKLAVKYMCVDPATDVKVYRTEGEKDSHFDGWIVSGYSVHQATLINRHDASKALYIDGPSRTWVRDVPVNYFVLAADPEALEHRVFQKSQEETEDEDSAAAWKAWTHNYNSAWSERRRALLARPTVHEQRDETIFAISATSNSTKDSAAAWLHQLGKEIPRLRELSVVFRMRHIGSELAPAEEETTPVASQQ